MSKLVVTFKALSFPEDGKLIPIGTKSSGTFESKKIGSPGIRQMIQKDLDDFLNVVGDKALLLPANNVEPRRLYSQELLALSKLVEDGSRVLESTIFEEHDHQLLFLKIRRNE